MKEILFRGKALYNKDIWIEGYLVKTPTTNLYLIHTENGGIYAVEPESICQYTGQTDKNGRKIWENDIVKYEFEDDEFVVTWNKQELRYDLSRGMDTSFHFDYTDLDHIEVIGDIFSK